MHKLLFSFIHSIALSKTLAFRHDLLTYPLAFAHFCEDQSGAARSTNVRIGHVVLDTVQVMEIEQQLNSFLQSEKPFLKQGYTLYQMAIDVNIPLHHLSAFINQHYGVNFNDFINQFRIYHCINKIMDGECKLKKLETIALESGFSNRNTFASAFKKVTGLTPSRYLKNLTIEPK